MKRILLSIAILLISLIAISVQAQDVNQDCVGSGITYGPGNNFCAGNVIFRGSQYYGSGVATYSWTGPNNFTANTANFSIPNCTIANAGVYTLEINNGCKIIKLETTINVDLPAVGGTTIDVNNPTESKIIVCRNETKTLTLKSYVGRVVKWQYQVDGTSVWIDIPNSASLQWTLINNSKNSQNIYYRAAVQSTFGVCTTAAQAVFSTPIFVKFKRTCVNSRDIEGDMVVNKSFTAKAYPSVTSSLVNIEIDGVGEGLLDIQLFNVTGKLMQAVQRTTTEGYNTIPLNVEQLPVGLYIIKLRAGNKQEASVKINKI